MATVIAMALASGAAKAHANGKAGWCRAQHLSLTAASGPHTVQAQAGGAVLWFLQIRHHGASACMVENRLTLLSDRAASRASIKLRAYDSGVFAGGKPQRLVLSNSQKAFVELWYASPGTVTAVRGCGDHVVLTFGLSDGRGTLSARPPEGVALCPGSLGISPPISSATFLQFIQRSSTTPGKLSYAMEAR